MQKLVPLRFYHQQNNGEISTYENGSHENFLRIADLEKLKIHF